MPWEPRLPLTAAEQTVDFPAHHDHVTAQRSRVERAAAPRARRIAFLVAETGQAPRAQVDRLAASLRLALNTTMIFGFRSAQDEIDQLRQAEPVVAYSVPDAGRYAELARKGKAGIRLLLLERAKAAATAVAAAALGAYSVEDALEAKDALALTIAQTAARVLHNHVLELVGETLNLGRTAGALNLARPPEYSLRSEQLDKATCDPCTRLHGEITIVGSPEYFATLPPSGCLGGGRCRGIPVFGDTPLQVAQPAAA